MTSTSSHAPGTFCWVELAAHDPGAAKRFYTGMFGWTADESKFGPGDDDVYTTYRLDGRDAAAQSTMDQQRRGMGIPSHWLSYVSVASADESAGRVGGLGGTVLMEPFDVMDLGRMAIVQDPTGAVLALWQSGKHTGVGVRDEPNSLCWNELATTDAERAGAFYSGLFGWGTQAMEGGGGMPYTMFTSGEAMAGGMFQVTPDMQMPSVWLPYFAVEDADAGAERARSLGASLIVPPTDIPKIGRFSLLQDPQGAMVYIIKLEYPETS
ncbi:MAG TPA: VOC family protein [Longimicrobiaceae bacterium]|nr:VOC family protein [Longimicrobiaceae bacterium]